MVRVYEMGGEVSQNAEITFAGNIMSACEADGTEKEIGGASFEQNKLKISVSPYGIKTFKVKLSNIYPAQNFDYAYLPLNYDRKCFSWNAFRREGNFESGNSYAAELLPDSILTANNIPFRLGEKEIANGLSCKGNVIQLPAGKSFNKLYILAASTNGDNNAKFHGWIS